MEKAKILIADDEPNILKLAGVVLEEVGYKVLRAKDGKEAIKLASSDVPDLVITDVLMPGADGFEVCRAIRQDPKTMHLPIIILSAMGDQYNKLTGFGDGADDYISKPFDIEELKTRISTLLLRSKLQGSGQEKLLNKQVVSKPSGIGILDELLVDGLPEISNVMLLVPMGEMGLNFASDFLARGLCLEESCLYLSFASDEKDISRMLDSKLIQGNLDFFQKNNLFRFVSLKEDNIFSGKHTDEEAFALLSDKILNVSSELGQTVQHKKGGRRVLENLSSLFLSYDEKQILKFIKNLNRTTLSFGGVTTIYVFDLEILSQKHEQKLENLMDGVIELRKMDDKRYLQIKKFNGLNFERKWVEW